MQTSSIVHSSTPCTAFEGQKCIASGGLGSVARAAKAAIDQTAGSLSALPVLIFDDATSDIIELDWRGSEAEFAVRFDAQYPAIVEMAAEKTGEKARDGQTPLDEAADPGTAPRGPGRPRMGVVPREVTLLPRHWEWLASQPGGASVALRKLVEVARRSSEVKDRVRQASAVGYKFMSTMAGHEPGFEEASRALFAGDQRGVFELISAWPIDVQNHLKKILADAFWL